MQPYYSEVVEVARWCECLSPATDITDDKVQGVAVFWSTILSEAQRWLDNLVFLCFVIFLLWVTMFWRHSKEPYSWVYTVGGLFGLVTEKTVKKKLQEQNAAKNKELEEALRGAGEEFDEVLKEELSKKEKDHMEKTKEERWIHRQRMIQQRNNFDEEQLEMDRKLAAARIAQKPIARCYNCDALREQITKVSESSAYAELKAKVEKLEREKIDLAGEIEILMNVPKDVDPASPEQTIETLRNKVAHLSEKLVEAGYQGGSTKQVHQAESKLKTANEELQQSKAREETLARELQRVSSGLEEANKNTSLVYDEAVKEIADLTFEIEIAANAVVDAQAETARAIDKAQAESTRMDQALAEAQVESSRKDQAVAEAQAESRRKDQAVADAQAESRRKDSEIAKSRFDKGAADSRARDARNAERFTNQLIAELREEKEKLKNQLSAAAETRPVQPGMQQTAELHKRQMEIDRLRGNVKTVTSERDRLKDYMEKTEREKREKRLAEASQADSMNVG
ncbi:hypothetical protein MMC20_006111 [Loxospora ochrophaea]|nr:hypothetical protein [Loxospora ochrophaea]